MKFGIKLIILALLGSCSSIHKMGVRSVSPSFEESAAHLTQERSWEFFKDATPGNIKFLEHFVLNDPTNLILRRVLIKTYVAYAYAVPETLAYDDQLALTEDLKHQQEATVHYTKALDYGLEYLSKKEISRKNLLTLDEDKLIKKLKRETSRDDLLAILYTAQAWGSLIKLHKKDLPQMARVKVLFDYVCEEDPSIENGACDLFFAQYESSRDSQKGKQLFLKAMEKYPKHLLIRVSYLQHVSLPTFDQEEYDKQALILKDEFHKWEDLNRDNLENTSSYKGQERLNLYNAIARKRFEIMESHKSKTF